MTGLKVAEKSDDSAKTTTDVPVRRERRQSVLIGVVASLTTALVLGTIFVSVIFYLKGNKHDETPEWISWTRQNGVNRFHESVLIDVKHQTILFASPEAYRDNDDSSMALHDYNMGFVAFRDFSKNLCFVTRISNNTGFESARKTLESWQGKEMGMQPVKTARAEHRNMSSSELGPKLSQFCKGVPTHWFTLTSKNRIARDIKIRIKFLGIDIKIEIDW